MDSSPNRVRPTKLTTELDRIVTEKARQGWRSLQALDSALARRRFPRRIAKIARKGIKCFQDLASLDSNTKQAILPQIRHYELQLAVLESWQQRISEILMILFAIATVVVVFGSPLLAANMLNLDLNAIKAFTIFGIRIDNSPLPPIFGQNIQLGPGILWRLMFPNILVQTIMLMLVLNTTSSLIGYTRWVLLPGLFLCAALLFVIVSRLGSSSPDSLTFLVISALVGAVGFLIILQLVGMAAILTRAAINRAQSHRHPDAFLVKTLAQILTYVEHSPERWRYAKYKRPILGLLEEAASCVENDLYEMLNSGDPATNNWLSTTNQGIAAALRTKKRWVLTPKEDTRAHLIASIAQTLISAASGNWDALEKIEPEKISARQIWRDRVVGATRMLVLAVLPMLVLWAIQQSPLALHSPVSDYATVGAVLWVLLTVILALDPQFNAKLGAIKDITDILPLSGKGGKP